MMDADLMNAVTEAVNKVKPNLMQDLLSKKLLQDEKCVALYNIDMQEFNKKCLVYCSTLNKIW